MNKTIMLVQTTIFVLFCTAGSFESIGQVAQCFPQLNSFYLWYPPALIGLGLAVKEALTPAAAYATIEGGP